MQSENAIDKVYLLGTCLIDVYDPEAGLDAIALLQRCGYEAIFPQSQTCCGQPPFNSGYQSECLAIARKHIDLFHRDGNHYPVIVPSASCAGMIMKQYPKLFLDDPEYSLKAQQLSDRTHELLAFLASRLDFQPLKNCPQISVALHLSCASQREINVAPYWRELLEKMPNVTLLEPTNPGECCGFGGTFAVKSPDLSARMTADKVTNLTQTSAQIIVSGDAGCLLSMRSHLEHKARHHHAQVIPMMHLARFIQSQFELASSIEGNA